MPLAFRSRKVKFGEVELIYREIFNTFVKNPAKFFIPIKSKINTNAEKMVIELEKERKKTLNKIDFLHHIFTCYFFKFLNKKRFPQSKVIF
ncbi:probable site-specific recombinase [Riemerella anatipestifer RA-YM]|nr:probable site-specific recombinase [Riemerella anatipestifer RA-YM]